MDGQCCAGGVRFRLFPKPPYVHPEWPPETISVSSPPGTIGPGPADDRMRSDLPTDKRYSYGVNPGPLGTPRLDLPPFRRPIHRPVCPDDEGHFDLIPKGAPASLRTRMCSARSGSCWTSGSTISAGLLSGTTSPPLPPARNRHPAQSRQRLRRFRLHGSGGPSPPRRQAAAVCAQIST